MVTLVRTQIIGSLVTGGGMSTLAFEDPVSSEAAQVIVDAVATFWETLCTGLDEDVTFVPLGNPQRYAAATGELQQVFATDPGTPSAGIVSANAAPRASQGLIRWATDDIVDGRAIKGRTFVPGIPSAALTDLGGLSSTTQAAFTTAANDLITDTGNTLSVWHRPKNGVGGSSHLVTAASVWSELAVLRSRRD